MRMFDKMYIKTKANLMSAYADFKESERGDTNFISMLLIIGIVVVLAGLFLTLAKTTVFGTIKGKVTSFLSKL